MKTQESGRKKPINMVWIIKAPIRAVSKVLDLYVKGITNFSNAYNRPLRTMEEADPYSQRLPRSFTTSRLPDTDQQPEGALVRSISAGAIGETSTNIKIASFDMYMIPRHGQQLQSSESRKGAHRSCVVGMSKIDEDRACSFRKENLVLKSKLVGDSMLSKSHSDDGKVSNKRS